MSLCSPAFKTSAVPVSTTRLSTQGRPLGFLRAGAARAQAHGRLRHLVRPRCACCACALVPPTRAAHRTRLAGFTSGLVMLLPQGLRPPRFRAKRGAGCRAGGAGQRTHARLHLRVRSAAQPGLHSLGCFPRLRLLLVGCPCHSQTAPDSYLVVSLSIMQRDGPLLGRAPRVHRQVIGCGCLLLLRSVPGLSVPALPRSPSLPLHSRSRSPPRLPTAGATWGWSPSPPSSKCASARRGPWST